MTTTEEVEKILNERNEKLMKLIEEIVETAAEEKVKKFTRGDRVKYVKKGPIGWEWYDYAKSAGLELNEVNSVIDVDYTKKGKPYVIINSYHIHPNHFELATTDEEKSIPVRQILVEQTNGEIAEILRRIIVKESTTIKEGLVIVEVSQRAGLDIWEKKKSIIKKKMV